MQTQGAEQSIAKTERGEKTVEIKKLDGFALGYCQVTFTTSYWPLKISLEQGKIMSEAEKTQYKCLLCGEEFATIPELAKHDARVHLKLGRKQEESDRQDAKA